MIPPLISTCDIAPAEKERTDWGNRNEVGERNNWDVVERLNERFILLTSSHLKELGKNIFSGSDLVFDPVSFRTGQDGGGGGPFRFPSHLKEENPVISRDCGRQNVGT